MVIARFGKERFLGTVMVSFGPARENKLRTALLTNFTSAMLLLDLSLITYVATVRA